MFGPAEWFDPLPGPGHHAETDADTETTTGECQYQRDAGRDTREDAGPDPADTYPRNNKTAGE